MSSYLIERIDGLANLELVIGSEVDALDGDGDRLDRVRLRDRASGGIREIAARHLFLFIGADPNTDWLKESNVALDKRGFVLTGAAAGAERLPHESRCPGVFAVGDVRSGAPKRVAAAVGEGSVAVGQIHQYLTTRSTAAERLS